MHGRLPGLTIQGSRGNALLEPESESWYVAHRREALNGSYSLQVFVWPPGEPTAAPWERSSKSATSAWTTGPCETTRV